MELPDATPSAMFGPMPSAVAGAVLRSSTNEVIAIAAHATANSTFTSRMVAELAGAGFRAALERGGREVVSSQELGSQLGVTPAQIRKDLSYFGRFGKQGRGYNVRRLLEELHQILGLDRKWTMVVVGVGQLGRAVLSYAGF